jgi:3-deoxy-7-phosphoheptulonate synthase
MIITISKDASSDQRAQLMALLCRISDSQCPIATTVVGEREVIALELPRLDAATSAALEQQSAVERIVTVKTPYQLVSRAFQPESTRITIGEAHNCETVTIGGDEDPVIMAGPCAVENQGQLLTIARAVKRVGAQVIRGGAFKPRTSPYQFQGLGIEGLHLLTQAREETGLPTITEVMEPAMVDAVAEHADVWQIGARNVQNYPLLRAVGEHPAKLPVLLKRGLSSTIDEWLLAAEYIVAAGNPNVILCERGIRSFDPQTRNVLDLSCVPLLRQLTHLPIIVDPSHATGRRELVPIMARAGVAAEAHGLIIETHVEPDKALCDGKQSITPEQLGKIIRQVQAMTSIMKEELAAAPVA